MDQVPISRSSTQPPAAVLASLPLAAKEYKKQNTSHHMTWQDNLTQYLLTRKGNAKQDKSIALQDNVQCGRTPSSKIKQTTKTNRSERQGSVTQRADQPAAVLASPGNQRKLKTKTNRDASQLHPPPHSERNQQDKTRQDYRNAR